MYSDSAFLTIFVPENLPHVFTLLAKEAPGAAGAAGSPPDGPRAAPPGRRGRGRDGAHTKRQMGKQSSVFNPGLRKTKLLFVFIMHLLLLSSSLLVCGVLSTRETWNVSREGLEK